MERLRGTLLTELTLFAPGVVEVVSNEACESKDDSGYDADESEGGEARGAVIAGVEAEVAADGGDECAEKDVKESFHDGRRDACSKVCNAKKAAHD